MPKGSLGSLSCIVTEAPTIPCFWMELAVSHTPLPGVSPAPGKIVKSDIIRPTLCNRKRKLWEVTGPVLTAMGFFSNSKPKMNLAVQAKWRHLGTAHSGGHFHLNHQDPRWHSIGTFLDQIQPSHAEDKTFYLQALRSLPWSLGFHAEQTHVKNLTEDCPVDFFNQNKTAYEFYLFISSVQREKKRHNLFSQWDIHLIRCHKIE